MRLGARRPAGAGRRSDRARGRLIATRPILLWLDQPGPYVRGATRAGLGAVFDLLGVPLAAEPADDLLARAEALLAWRPPARLATRAPNLRWIHSLTAGAEQWLASPDLPRDAVLTCSRGVHRLSMPEHILAALFLVQKRLASIVLDQRERRWTRHVNDTLAGKTLGILGLGTIGAELARKASALEMRVIGTRRRGGAVAHVDRVHGVEGVGQVLAESDFVVLLLPSTEQTRGIVNAKTLALMKPSAYLLNFARGDLVVDQDLVEAVTARRIAGAVLDVFTREPLPADSPLWTTEGIVIFPHVGGLHPQRDELVAALWVDNLGRFSRREPLLHVVDRELGY